MIHILIPFAALLLSGCFPVYTLVRPEVELQVRDASGSPVKGAKAILTTRANPHQRLMRQETFDSSENGIVAIESRRQWELVLLTLHGSNHYYWPWCVQAPGYQKIEGKMQRNGALTIDGDYESRDSSRPVTLTLEKSDSPSECFLYPREQFREP